VLLLSVSLSLPSKLCVCLQGREDVETCNNGARLGVDKDQMLSNSHYVWLRVCCERPHRLFADVVDVSVHLAVEQDAVSQDRRESCLHTLVS